MIALPLEMISNILSRLPVKTVVRLECVCKSWRSLIRSTDFIANHLRHSLTPGRGFLLHVPYVLSFAANGPNLCTLLSETNFGKRGQVQFPLDQSSFHFQIVDSINGLVCFSEKKQETVYPAIFTIMLYVWNPALRKLKQLGSPRMMERLTDNSGVIIDGFGYDPRSNVYKAVRIWYSRLSEFSYEAYEVEVFTLGCDCWKSFKPKKYVNTIAGGGSVAYVNGVIHWLANRSMNEIYTSILSFVVSTETFQEIPMPENYLEGIESEQANRLIMLIGEFKGSLSVAVQGTPIHGSSNKEQLSIWIMKDYGMASSWTKQLKVMLMESVEMVLGFTRYGEVLLQKENGNVICCYDTRVNKYYRVWKSSGSEEFMELCEVIKFSESLVWFDY